MSKKGIEELKKEYEEIRMSDSQVDAFKQTIERAKKDNRKSGFKGVWKYATAAVAAVLLTFIILPNTSAGIAHAMGNIPLIGNVVKVVTFRDYDYESERQHADIDVPQLATTDITAEGGEAYVGNEAEPVAYTLKETTDEINNEIEVLTNEIIDEFEAGLQKEQGYQEVVVSHEVVCTTDQYFTLKIMHYMGSGSGTQWNYYYTIDLTTGERIRLQDLFVVGVDYMTPINEEIVRQMREQMTADEDKHYWLDEEIAEWNFKSITEETQFYMNESGNIVISFDEGEVAPMYMGVVTFEIPAEVLEDIRK